MRNDQNDTLARFEVLAARAREDAYPVVEVREAVLESICRDSWEETRPLLFLTAGSAIAAVLFAIVGVSAYLQLQDPMRYVQEWVQIAGVL